MEKNTLLLLLLNRQWLNYALLLRRLVQLHKFGSLFCVFRENWNVLTYLTTKAFLKVAGVKKFSLSILHSIDESCIGWAGLSSHYVINQCSFLKKFTMERSNTIQKSLFYESKATYSVSKYLLQCNMGIHDN